MAGMIRGTGMRRRGIVCAGAALVLCAAVGTAPARAQDAESHYTSVAEKACRTTEKAEPGEGEFAVRVCPGRAGYVIRIGEGDLRMAVSAGRNIAAAAKEPAAEQSFGPFNHVNDTIEWRSPKGGPPYALIQRWFISDSANPGADGRPPSFGLMVVTRLPPGPVCHVAYVDVRANPNANALAREAADTLARNFRCGTDDIRVVGNRGRAVELSGR
jgi:hypothetical protein